MEPVVPEKLDKQKVTYYYKNEYTSTNYTLLLFLCILLTKSPSL